MDNNFNNQNATLSEKEKHLKHNKRLLKIDILLVTCAILSFIILCVFGFIIIKNTLWQILLIIQAFINLTLGIVISLIIQTKIGTFKCNNCHNTITPTLKQIMFTLQFGSTKQLECPKCSKKTWHKKTAEENFDKQDNN